MRSKCYSSVAFEHNHKTDHSKLHKGHNAVENICIIYCVSYLTLPFKNLRSVRFLNIFEEVSYAHQGCKKCSKNSNFVKYYYS